MTLEEAQDLVTLARSPAGNRYLRRLANDLEKATKGLYYETDDGKLRAFQGQARALFEQLQEFERARETVERGTPQHGSPG